MRRQPERTLSWHKPNFVTGNNFYDTTGDVVTAILPGGAQEALYRTYLDSLAPGLPPRPAS